MCCSFYKTEMLYMENKKCQTKRISYLLVSHRPTPSVNLRQSFLSLPQNKDYGILDIRLFQNPLQ